MATNPDAIKTAFVHVPKCGGQSFDEHLQYVYDGRPQLDIYDKPYGAIYDLADFDRLPREKITNYSCIRGHVPFANYRAKLTDSDMQDYFFVAVLRNPVDFMISLYSYVKKSPEHPDYNWIKGASLKDFFVRQQASSYQSWFVSGATDFETARGTLEKYYSGFCILDDLNEFTALYYRFMNKVGGDERSRTNVSQSDKYLEEISADDLAWLTESMFDDVLLTSWVKDNWREHTRKTMVKRWGSDLTEDDFEEIELQGI